MQPSFRTFKKMPLYNCAWNINDVNTTLLHLTLSNSIALKIMQLLGKLNAVAVSRRAYLKLKQKQLQIYSSGASIWKPFPAFSSA